MCVCSVDHKTAQIYRWKMLNTHFLLQIPNIITIAITKLIDCVSWSKEYYRVLSEPDAGFPSPSDRYRGFSPTTSIWPTLIYDDVAHMLPRDLIHLAKTFTHQLQTTMIDEVLTLSRRSGIYARAHLYDCQSSKVRKFYVGPFPGVFPSYRIFEHAYGIHFCVNILYRVVCVRGMKSFAAQHVDHDSPRNGRDCARLMTGKITFIIQADWMFVCVCAGRVMKWMMCLRVI